MDLLSSIITSASDITTNWSALIAATCVSTVCFGLIGAHIYYKNVYSYWEKKGIKGPKPWPFVGNMLQLLLSKRLSMELQLPREYGKVYGIYQGKKPMLVIADPEILQQICIKDFDVFPNHELNKFANKYQRNFILFLKDNHWRKVRALMSPTFTSGKMKKMFRFLDACADDLVEAYKEQLPGCFFSLSTREFNDVYAFVNTKELYSLFTMDAITTCCYGLKLERAGSANLKTAATRNDFVNTAMKMFKFNIIRVLAVALIPEFILKLFGFEISPQSDTDPLASRVNELLVKRKKSQKKFDDYLQLLIDAKLDDKMEFNDMDLAENHHAGLTQETLIENQKRMVEETKSKLRPGMDVVLSDIEILTGAVFLLAVGLETTGTLLSNCTQALAFHPKVQERLYLDLLKIAQCNEDYTKYTFSYEAITTCHYLDAVLAETLRLLSPIINLDRVSNREYRIEKYNLDLPANQRIMLAFYAILNDPDNWEEADKFIPERFLPGNKEKIVPGAYCPFGIGPRHCLGMRFSLTESKIALAKMVLNFRFAPAPGTRFPPEPAFILVLHKLKNPTVKISPRKANNFNN